MGLDTCPKLTSSSGSEGQTLEVDHTAGSPECGFFLLLCACLPSCFSLSHDSVSFCYRPSGQGAGAFPAGATGEHYQVSSHRSWACCDRGRDSLQLLESWVTRHLGDLGGKLPYVRHGRCPGLLQRHTAVEMCSWLRV